VNHSHGRTGLKRYEQLDLGNLTSTAAHHLLRSATLVSIQRYLTRGDINLISLVVTLNSL